MSRSLRVDPNTRAGLSQLRQVAAQAVTIELVEPDTSGEVALETALGRGEEVYGHSTGYGALASHSAADPSTQQEQLIAHLATGTGPVLDARSARAVVFERLVTLSRGHSAASPPLMKRLAAVLSGPYAPSIPSYGSVGASGDLTPLAHLALNLQDPTQFLRGASALGQLKAPRWSPLAFSRRDALALVNGTSASNAVAILAWWDLAEIFPLALQSMARMVEAIPAPVQAYAAELHELRGQPGQNLVAELLRSFVEPESFPPPVTPGRHHETHLQAAYSFRCIPQILGPSVEALRTAALSLERELNGVTDNPVFVDPDGVYHGGNFHGQIVAQVCDSLSLAAANLANLMDRQIARITDPLLNHGLPPFLTGARAGAQSGFMGAQVTATALSTEIRASAQRRYLLESRSTNGANQDVVSMSTPAALALYQTLPRLRELLAIHLMVAVQAHEQRFHRAPANAVSQTAFTLSSWVREMSPPLREDRPLSQDIERISAALAEATVHGNAPWLQPTTGRALWMRLFPEAPRELP